MLYEVRKPRMDDRKQVYELFDLTIKDNFKAECIVDQLEQIAREEIKTLQRNFDKYLHTKNIIMEAQVILLL